ncbi:MAG: preprotein translocase subunit SecG, partial [Pseudomonadota bacterium]
KADAPKADAPKADAPKADAPKAEPTKLIVEAEQLDSTSTKDVSVQSTKDKETMTPVKPEPKK